MTPQRNRQLRQIQPLYTWIVDIVQFLAPDNKKYWYVLFVEFNSRYACIYPTKEEVNENTVAAQRGRIKAEEFVEILTANFGYDDMKIERLMGDADKVFTSNITTRILNAMKIESAFLPSAASNHTLTSILDRVVRTLRDMAFNLKLEKLTPKDLKNLCKIYNTTKHNTLSQVLGFPATPELLHKNSNLQLLFIRRLKGINWLKVRQRGFVLPEGSKVYMRMKGDKFGKGRRAQVSDKVCKVIRHEGTKYEVEDEDGQKYIVPRRDLAPNYKATRSDNHLNQDQKQSHPLGAQDHLPSSI